MARASTSRGRGSTSGGRSRDFQEDFSVLLEPDTLELIKLNRLKLVPIDQDDRDEPCNTCVDFERVRNERDIARTRLEDRDKEVIELRRRVVELEDEVAVRGASQLRRQLDETSQAKEDLEVLLASQGDTFNELQNECQREMEEERRRREEAERRLEEREGRLRELENQLMENDSKFQKRERTLQENMARDRNRIIALSNEKEMITQERYKFSGFVRQVKIVMGYQDQDGDELLANGQLDRILGEIRKLKEYKSKDSEELISNRELLKHIYGLIGKATFINEAGREDNVQSSSSLSTTRSSPSTSTSYFRINNEPSRRSLFLSKNPTPPPSGISSAVSTPVAPPTPPSTPITVAEMPSTSAAAAVHPAAVRISSASPNPLSPNLPEPSTSTNAHSQQSVSMITSPGPTPPGVAAIPSSSFQGGISSSSSSQASQIPTTPPGPPTSPNRLMIINSFSLASNNQSQPVAQPLSTFPSTTSPTAPPPIVVPPPPPPPVNNIPPKRTKNPLVNRNGQLTEFCVSSKKHGVNKACSKFRCLCGNNYTNEKSLNVHIRKMKTAWKYKCNKCLHYFFYKSDLTRHLARSSKCSESSETGRSAGFLNDTLFDELIGVRGPSVPPPSATPSVTGITLTISGSRQGTFTKFQHRGKRKLQQEILKRKRHAPWVSKNGAVQGSWYCVCGSKFGLRASMQTHVQYFTQDWKFQCEHCPETFLYLAYLKKHLASTHKMKNALKEYNMGCQLCGSLFKKRSDYYRHRKIIHNLVRRRPGTSSASKATETPAPKTPEKSKTPPPPPNPNAIPLPPPPSLLEPQPGPSGSTLKKKLVEIIDVPSDDDVDMVSVPPSPVTVKQERAPSPSPSTYSSSAESVESSASGEGQNHAPVEPDPLYVDARNPNAQLYSCECGKTYLSRSALGLHIKTMKFGNIYVCLTCNKGFRQLINLKNHMTCVHRDVYRGFYCGLCKMQFTSSRLFKIHRAKEHDS